MHITVRLRAGTGALLVSLLLNAGCRGGPSKTEALEAIRAAVPGSDTATLLERVWQDGPPWFSCAEVLAKLDKPVDSAVVRDAVGNWRYLVTSGWIVLRDSARGVVSDPGWCYATLSPDGALAAREWRARPGTIFPTGADRRGWIVPIGRRRFVVTGSPRSTGRDSASVEYAATVTPNVNGSAMGADRDSARFVAQLRRVDGQWRVVGATPGASGAPPGAVSLNQARTAPPAPRTAPAARTRERVLRR